jgi:hypothetical protein
MASPISVLKHLVDNIPASGPLKRSREGLAQAKQSASRTIEEEHEDLGCTLDFCLEQTPPGCMGDPDPEDGLIN